MKCRLAGVKENLAVPLMAAKAPAESVYANACNTWRSLTIFASPHRWKTV